MSRVLYRYVKTDFDSGSELRQFKIRLRQRDIGSHAERSAMDGRVKTALKDETFKVMDRWRLVRVQRKMG